MKAAEKRMRKLRQRRNQLAKMRGKEKQLERVQMEIRRTMKAFNNRYSKIMEK
jgi:hypothetical protein